MFDNTKGPLQMPSVLPEIVQELNEDGKKTRPSDIKSPPIFSRFESNIVTVAAGALACMCSIAILILSIKQFRIQSLLSSLGLVSLIPPAKAYYLSEILLAKTMKTPSFLARHNQNEKVICSHPMLTAVGSAIAIFGAAYAVYQVFRSLSWYSGYKNSRSCTMYFFLYHDDFYAPLQIKSLSGHIYMYKMENKLLLSQVTLQKHFLWDTVMMNWVMFKYSNMMSQLLCLSL